MEVLYLYDGTFSGFLSAVFDAYARREMPLKISSEENAQMPLGGFVYRVTSDEEKSERVMKKLCALLGRRGFFRLFRAFLSEEDDREQALFGFIRLALQRGKETEKMLSETCVIRTMELSQKTSKEAEHLRGFLRFRKLSSNIFYAEFSSKTDCLSNLAFHFKRRLSSLDFIINDVKRKKAALYQKGDLEIFSYDSFEAPKDSEGEEGLQQMWKDFYKIAAIKERKNERCRMSHMPKRFWAYMCEMEDAK